MSLLERYEQLRNAGRVRERALFAATREPSELELQARWFAGDFGRQFRTTCGRQIEVVQFGTWNREAGPDFTDAAVRVDSDELLRGSIEFDLTNRSWETHGHSTNPAFEATALHVFVRANEQAFFTRTLGHRNALQVYVDLATLPEKFSANVPLARPGRCQAPLRDLPAERIESVLAGAARFRLRRKAARLRSLIDAHGRDEALFQELAAALGYKQNKLPFTLIFGDDPRRAQFVRRVAQQQGLLQIYEDFCLQDNSDCAQCPFPEQMQKWT